MKKIILVKLLLFFLTGMLYAQEREIFRQGVGKSGDEIHFGEGKKTSGKKEGLWVLYVGKLADQLETKYKLGEGLYLNDKQVGEWKTYHENGKLLSIGKFENGVQTGEWKIYHESGQLSCIIKFENGQPTGEYKSYHKNGQLSDIGELKNGIQIGEWKFYDENGGLKETMNY